MAANNQPSMTYHGQEFRVRVEITKAQAMESPEYPTDLLKRARLKMEAIHNEGKISFFDVFENKLANVWNALRKAENEPLTLSVAFTLAAGSPELVGLTIEKGPSEKSALTVSVSQDANRKLWTKEFIRATIIHKARELGVIDPLSMAQVQSCISRILSGDDLKGYAIPLVKTLPTMDLAGKPYGILANKARCEIAVLIADLGELQQPKNLEVLNQSIIKTIDKLKAQLSGGHFRYHRNDFLQCLSSAWKGPERVGIGMPMTVLAVTGQGPQAKAPEIPKLIEFKIAPNKLSAQIVNFKPELFDHPTFKFTRESLLHEMSLSNINFGLTDALWLDLEAAWGERQDLNGRTVAEGVVALPGAEPYVHLTYKDAPELEQTSQVINMRDAQQRTLVHAGQLVAEIRYHTPPVPGKTVTGQTVHVESPAFDIKLGAGIAQREAGKFYATDDGIPVYESDVLTVNKTYMHRGDVDLKSGNIRFDGPVEIQGSVDTGAVVDVLGPLTINGMIRGGSVYSKNGITVKQGIVTTDKGLVKCDGDIKAEFIENSRIECTGSLLVNKGILNSQVFVGQTIRVFATESVVGGGIISCRDALIAQNIGFPSGAKTVLIIGADARSQKRITTRKSRLEALKAAQEKYKLELRELQSKRDAQLTPKHKELKKKLAGLVNKSRSALEKAERAVVHAQAAIVYNSAAVIAAYNKLSTNCSIELGGIGIPLDNENIGVAMTTKKRRGDTYICAVEDIKAEIDRLTGKDESTRPKKVS